MKDSDFTRNNVFFSLFLADKEKKVVTITVQVGMREMTQSLDRST